jgi:hypothetical protein
MPSYPKSGKSFKLIPFFRRPAPTAAHPEQPMKLIYTIIKILILLVFLLLAITNTHTVSFFYLPGQNVNLPLIVVLFGAFIIGIVFGMFALFGRLLTLRSENNRLRAEVKKYAHLSEKDLTPVKTETPATASETAPKA